MTRRRSCPGSEARATSTPPSAESDSTCFADILSQLRRRRRAAERLALLDCGCSDPWPCRCTEPPLTDRALDGWRDAAGHLIESGKTPLLPLEVLKALYRRGGTDRALAEELHAASGGAIA